MKTPKAPVTQSDKLSDRSLAQAFKEISKTNPETFLIPKSLIGKAVLIKGDLAGKEDILINGRVEGTIAMRHNQLEIGKQGYIEANVFAKNVIIHGELKGDVYASEKVIVAKTGRVIGNISAPDVSMEEGAQLIGYIDMVKHDISDHDMDTTTKPASLSLLLKKVQELAHFQSISPNKNTHLPAINHNELNLDNALSKELLGFEADNYSSAKSILGESIMIKGEMHSDEDVVINGLFGGTIYFKNTHLEIGPHSHIKANIFVKSLVCHGEIRSDIYANDFVVVKKTGQVYGKIFSPRFSIESGCVFRGEVEMESQNIEQAFIDITTAANAPKVPGSGEITTSNDILAGTID